MLTQKAKINLLAWSMALPALILLLAFIFMPMANSAYYSLFKWNLVGDKKFILFDNYKYIFGSDQSFKAALANTFTYTILNMVLTFTLAFATALIFNAESKIAKFVRSAAFVPVVVPITVLGIIWKMIYEPQFGIINQFLSIFGVAGPKWLFDSKLAMVAVVIFNVWKEFGLYTIILVGGLQKIPRDMYEVARIEGANPLETLRMVTVPMLKPILFFVSTILFINSFKAFDHIWVMTGGGPGNATSTLVTYIYSKVFDSVGLASATSVILFIIVFTATISRYFLSKGGAVNE